MSTRFDLPNAVRRRAIHAGATRWLATLDEIVDTLAERWRLRVDAVLTGGTESLVLSAVRDDGTAAVLKIGLPGSAQLDQEAAVLGAARGRGYARCLGHDGEHNALLVERLGEPLASLGLAPEALDDALCAILRSAWQPVPAQLTLMSGAAKAAWLEDYIERCWRELEQPCDRRVVDRAIVQCRERAATHDDSRSVLVHGDGHALNALLPFGGGRADAARFVDPDGLSAEREYDLGILAREWIDDVFLADPLRVGRTRTERLAAATGTDADTISAWGDIERVSSALGCLTIGLDEFGRRMLTAAEGLARAS